MDAAYCEEEGAGEGQRSGDHAVGEGGEHPAGKDVETYEEQRQRAEAVARYSQGVDGVLRPSEDTYQGRGGQKGEQGAQRGEDQNKAQAEC